MILVTGASGFIGSTVVRRLVRDDTSLVVAAVRKAYRGVEANVRGVIIGDLSPGTNWSRALAGVDKVIHAAARVHVLRSSNANALVEYRYTNVQSTLSLARQAAKKGVGRFVFISSVKVNGEETLGSSCFTADDVSVPKDPYAVSKLEAEQGLREISRDTGMQVVVIRPPLVYGPGVKGNFLTLMRLLYRGVPLPLGAIHNLRSLVAVDNLVDLLIVSLIHPAAANNTFLVSDGNDLSTTDLLRRLSVALGKQARLIPVPERLMVAGASLLGGRAMSRRLCGSLRVDIRKTQRQLNWSPPVSVDEGLRSAAQAFLSAIY